MINEGRCKLYLSIHAVQATVNYKYALLWPMGHKRRASSAAYTEPSHEKA
jgi:hypothetical protein